MKSRIANLNLIVAIGLLAGACGKSNFSSNGTPAPAVERAGQETPDGSKPGGSPTGYETPAKPGSDGGTGGGSTAGGGTGGGVNATPGSNSDQGAIAKCLTAWGQNPFGPNPTVYRKINASVQVLGFGSAVAVKDDQPTAQPALILINAAVGVLSQSKLELLNPNGWYCLKVDVNVLNNTTIDLACQAHLADSRVNVGVLSNNEPAGIVGVHVLSDVKVQRQPGC
jgi:hypothetical protein